MGAAVAAELDAEAAARAEVGEHRLQVAGRVGAFAVLQMRMSAMFDVRWAWRRSGARVSSATRPSAPR